MLGRQGDRGATTRSLSSVANGTRPSDPNRNAERSPSSTSGHLLASAGRTGPGRVCRGSAGTPRRGSAGDAWGTAAGPSRHWCRRRATTAPRRGGRGRTPAARRTPRLCSRRPGHPSRSAGPRCGIAACGPHRAPLTGHPGRSGRSPPDTQLRRASPALIRPPVSSDAAFRPPISVSRSIVTTTVAGTPPADGHRIGWPGLDVVHERQPYPVLRHRTGLWEPGQLSSGPARTGSGTRSPSGACASISCVQGRDGEPPVARCRKPSSTIVSNAVAAARRPAPPPAGGPPRHLLLPGQTTSSTRRPRIRSAFASCSTAFSQRKPRSRPPAPTTRPRQAAHPRRPRSPAPDRCAGHRPASAAAHVPHGAPGLHRGEQFRCASARVVRVALAHQLGGESHKTSETRPHRRRLLQHPHHQRIELRTRLGKSVQRITRVAGRHRPERSHRRPRSAPRGHPRATAMTRCSSECWTADMEPSLRTPTDNPDPDQGEPVDSSLRRGLVDAQWLAPVVAQAGSRIRRRG